MKKHHLTREDFEAFCQLLQEELDYKIKDKTQHQCQVIIDEKKSVVIRLMEGVIGATDRIPGIRLTSYHNGIFRLCFE
jgi:hypothetical protein